LNKTRQQKGEGTGQKKKTHRARAERTRVLAKKGYRETRQAFQIDQEKTKKKTRGKNEEDPGVLISDVSQVFSCAPILSPKNGVDVGVRAKAGTLFPVRGGVYLKMFGELKLARGTRDKSVRVEQY